MKFSRFTRTSTVAAVGALVVAGGLVAPPSTAQAAPHPNVVYGHMQVSVAQLGVAPAAQVAPQLIPRLAPQSTNTKMASWSYVEKHIPGMTIGPDSATGYGKLTFTKFTKVNSKEYDFNWKVVESGNPAIVGAQDGVSANPDHSGVSPYGSCAAFHHSDCWFDPSSWDWSSIFGSSGSFLWGELSECAQGAYHGLQAVLTAPLFARLGVFLARGAELTPEGAAVGIGTGCLWGMVGS